MAKKLTRDNANKKLFGVCAGVANYFDSDPTIIRLAFVIFTLCGGCGILLYLVMALIMPTDGSTTV